LRNLKLLWQVIWRWFTILKYSFLVLAFLLRLSFCNIQFENISIVVIIQTHKICVTGFLIINVWFQLYLSQVQDDLTYLVFRYSISRKLRNIINRSLNIDFWRWTFVSVKSSSGTANLFCLWVEMINQGCTCYN